MSRYHDIKRNLIKVLAIQLALFGAMTLITPCSSHAVAAQSQQTQTSGKKTPSKTKPPAIKAPAPSAQTSISPGSLPKVDSNTGTIKRILSAFFAIIGAFALFSMTASGLKYVTSAGDPQKTSEAKKGVIFAVVGLMLAISAEAIVSFVIHWGAP